MNKLPDCPLRKVQAKSENDRWYLCSGGVNFLSLGADAALCYHCQVPKAGLSEVLQCPHNDIYTFLETDQENQAVIRYEVQCFAQPGDQHCSQCPEIRANQPVNDQSTSGH